MNKPVSDSVNPDNPLRNAMREARLAFFLVGMFSFVLNMLILITPLYMLQVFDRVLTSGRTETLMFLTMIAMAGTLLYGSLEGVRAFLLARLGHWMERRMSRQILLRSFGEAGQSGLLRDYLQVQNFVASPSVAPFFDAPWVPLFLVVMWLLHPLMGVLAILSAIVLGALALLNERLTRRKLEEAQKGQGAVMVSLAQAARNSEVIEAMNMGPALASRMGAPLDTAQDQLRGAADQAGLILGTIKFIRLSVQIGVMGLGAWLVLQGEMSPGGMIAGSIILGRALAPVEQAIGAWRGFVGARTSYKKLNEVFDGYTPQGERTTLPDPHGHLTVEGVSFAPPMTTKPILKRVSFEARPGQILAVIGPSGAGKSMLCRLITGVWTAQAGAVRLDGAEIGHWDKEQLATCMGYLPQDVELFSGTVRDNIARMGSGEDEDVISAAKIAGAHDMIQRLPAGYDSEVGPGGASLSAGQRQRIGLARALYGDPKLLVLDEPNSNLDEDGERALLAAMLQMKKNGTTVVVVAHRKTILQVVDTLLLLADGEVEGFGPRDQILQALQTARAAPGDGPPAGGTPTNPVVEGS